MGEGSSRSAGDPPGVTVTASMSAQSLVAQPGLSAGGGLAQRELGDLRAGGLGQCAGFHAEDCVRSAGGGPHVVVLQEIGVTEHAQWLERSDGGDTADREARVCAHARCVGTRDPAACDLPPDAPRPAGCRPRRARGLGGRRT